MLSIWISDLLSADRAHTGTICFKVFFYVELQSALSALPQLLQTAGLCRVQHPLVCDPRDRVALSESLPL